MGTEYLENGEMKAEIKRELNKTFLILETENVYREDYQMRMLKVNKIAGVLEVRGSGIGGGSRYEYNVSGKTTMQAIYEKQKLHAQDMKEFLFQLSETMERAEEYFLNPERLLLNPQYIFFEEGRYYFCYCPFAKEPVWTAFRRLMDYFVQWTDYGDIKSVKTAFMLHRETMEDNYSLKKILERLEEEKEEQEKSALRTLSPEEPRALENVYEREEHDWITSQETASKIMEETDNLWTPVKRFLQKHRKPKWGDWDGVYIEEEEL